MTQTNIQYIIYNYTLNSLESNHTVDMALQTIKNSTVSAFDIPTHHLVVFM